MERKESEGVEEEEKKEVPAALSAPEPEKNDDFETLMTLTRV